MVRLSCGILLVPVVLLAAVTYMCPANPVFAYKGGDYSQAIYTDLTNPDLVCGDHICGPGETPQPPAAAEPANSS